MIASLPRKSLPPIAVGDRLRVELRSVARRSITIETPPFQDEGFRGRILPSVFSVAGLLERKSMARAFIEGCVDEIDADALIIPAFARLIRDAQERLADGLSLQRILAKPPSGFEGVLYFPMMGHIDDPIAEHEEALWQACANFIRVGGAPNV